MNKESFKRKGIHAAIVTGAFAIAFAMIVMQSITPRLKLDEQGYPCITWDGNIAGATENSTIGAASSGFLWIGFMNHTASPATAYDYNGTELFETWCNVSLDADGAAGTTNHAYASYGGFNLVLRWGVTFDIVVRYRGNVTNAKNLTIFNAANCRVKINASGGGVTLAEVTLTNVISSNASDHTFIWLNAYADNGGAGYTLNKGGTCTITNIKIEFNY